MNVQPSELAALDARLAALGFELDSFGLQPLRCAAAAMANKKQVYADGECKAIGQMMADIKCVFVECSHPATSSYRGKHVIERVRERHWARTSGTYVTNGEFIRACMLLGYKHSRLSRAEAPNCHFRLALADWAQSCLT